MNTSIVLLIHVLVVLAFALGGFLLSMTYSSAGYGAAVGVAAALVLYYFWGKNALAVSDASPK